MTDTTNGCDPINNKQRKQLSQMLEPRLSEQLLDSFFAVYREHGFGFLEGVYSNSMAVELQDLGLEVLREVPVEVSYRGVPVGRYRLDLVVNDRLLVEVKATKALTDADERQLLNYLRASRLEIGYLLHFGPVPAFRRFIYTNDRKVSQR
jgi:GxxExxY protein